MYTNIRDKITRDFLELKIWVNQLPNSRSVNQIESANYGLFFVYIYGIYEEVIRDTVATTITALNQSHIGIDQCIFSLYSLIFSNEYDSISGVGRDHKWERRWDISNKLLANPQVNIVSDIFPTDGKNIRYRQLESIAKSFGITDDILPRNELGGYIDEMVRNRNDIAHGNKRPKEIGRQYSISDLTSRCEYISEICEYFVNVFDMYISEAKYKRTANGSN